MPTRTRPRLEAEPREAVRQKSALRRLRKSGMVPATVFGHGEPVHVTLSSRTVGDFLRHHAAGAIIDVMLNGRPTTALIRELDRHPITGEVTHMGFQRVDLRETIKSSVPIVFAGEEALIAEGLVLERQHAEVEVHGEAALIPESIVADVHGLGAGTTLRVADLHFPDGITPTKDTDIPVARITLPSVPEDVAAALDAEIIDRAEATGQTVEEVEEGEGTEVPAEVA